MEVLLTEKNEPFLESPAYSLADAASYVRVPYQTLRYWAMGRKTTLPLITLPQYDRPALSFLNLLECHVLHALRTYFELRIQMVRKALDTLTNLEPSRHPLLTATLKTDRVDLFLGNFGGSVDQSYKPSIRNERGAKNLFATHRMAR